MAYKNDYKVSYGPNPGSTSPSLEKDFITVPGADYTNTGIKGNLEQSLEAESAKTQAMFDADSPYDMAMAATNNLENVGDALDPGKGLGAVAGMLKNEGFKIGKAGKDFMKNEILKSSGYGYKPLDTQYLRGNMWSSKDVAGKQEFLDTLYSSRTPSEIYRSKASASTTDAKHKGFTTKIQPSDFLALASDTGYGYKEEVRLGNEYAEEMLNQALDKSRPQVRLQTPQLTMKLDDASKTITVVGHEGRHRSMAMSSMFGGRAGVYQPTDIKLKADTFGDDEISDELRRRSYENEEFLDYTVVTQDGKNTGKTLREIQQEGLSLDEFKK